MKIIKRNKVFNTYRLCEIVFNNVFNVAVIKNCVYFALILSILLACLILNLLIKESQQLADDRHRNFPTDLKYILFWRQSRVNKRVPYSKNQPDFLPGQTMFINQKCEFINCFITYDKKLLRASTKNFDVVVFNINDIYTVKRRTRNLSRSPEQIYIFNSMDSASLFPVCFPVYDNFFNLTWTYKLDSDIPQPFINILNFKNEWIGPKKQMEWVVNMKHTRRYKNKIRSKTKAVAWIVNKCRSRRKHNKLVTDLRRELSGYNYSLDIYGHCGGIKCPGGNILDCYKLIDRDYYFQLVLEDTTSADHVTERMGLAMMQTAIPIVQGGSEYASYLPPGSYINVKNSTIKELGAIIDYLIKNQHFHEYFMDWKNYYYFTIRAKNYVCDLCSYLNKNDKKVNKSLRNFRSWWNPNYRSQCKQKRLYDLFLEYDYD